MSKSFAVRYRERKSFVMLFYTVGILLALFLRTALSAVTTYKVITDEDANPYKQMPEPHIDERETEIKFWREKGHQTLQQKLKSKLNTNTAKNIIFFLGDGMSIPTITAARIFHGQNNAQNGEESRLFFETFPYVGLSKTYCVDKQVADSAATATAYLRGVKANYETIGVTAKVKSADCESSKIESNRPSSIIKWAQDAGKATGVVTSTRITDASPAGAYAHVPLRDMECDADVVELGLDTESCDFDIAKQLISEKVGQNIKVLMGGGRKKFLPEKGPSKHGNGKRLDKDLIEEWKNEKRNRKVNGAYITTAAELQNLDIQSTDYLLGLFADNNLAYNVEKPETQPTLSQMTETAVKLLQKEKNGFFLFVEGGMIDKAHHLNQARKALDETIEFAKAIETATKLTSEEDTLIVVTSDHSHTMTINGYPARGHDILGIYGKSQYELPYSTLSYANGPGYVAESTPGKQHNLVNDDMKDVNYKYPALVPKEWESHGGDDVAVFARGPWAHLFTGNFEQSFIPIAEAFAAKIPIPDETLIPATTQPPTTPAAINPPTTSEPTLPSQSPKSDSLSIKSTISSYLIVISAAMIISKNIIV